MGLVSRVLLPSSVLPTRIRELIHLHPPLPTSGTLKLPRSLFVLVSSLRLFPLRFSTRMTLPSPPLLPLLFRSSSLLSQRVVLAAISIILTLTTIGLGIFVARAQFGEGLKESREAAQVAASTPRGQYFDEEAGDEMSGLASAGRRVTIE